MCYCVIMYVIVYNGTGSTILNGSTVYPVGGFNGRPSVDLAQADSHETISGIVLVTTMDIPTGTYGICSRFGKVRGLDTSAWSLGDRLYVSPTAAGGLTNTRPAFPDYDIQIGGVTVSDVSEGEIILEITM